MHGVNMNAFIRTKYIEKIKQCIIIQNKPMVPTTADGTMHVINSQIQTLRNVMKYGCNSVFVGE